LDGVAQDVALRVGTTASVMVMIGEGDPARTPPVPTALQQWPV
jgi:hypothetical protein